MDTRTHLKKRRICLICLSHSTGWLFFKTWNVLVFYLQADGHFRACERPVGESSRCSDQRGNTKKYIRVCFWNVILCINIKTQKYSKAFIYFFLIYIVYLCILDAVWSSDQQRSVKSSERHYELQRFRKLQSLSTFLVHVPCPCSLSVFLVHVPCPVLHQVSVGQSLCNSVTHCSSQTDCCRNHLSVCVAPLGSWQRLFNLWDANGDKTSEKFLCQAL